jgi:hypothetical protein
VVGAEDGKAIAANVSGHTLAPTVARANTIDGDDRRR